MLLVVLLILLNHFLQLLLRDELVLSDVVVEFLDLGYALFIFRLEHIAEHIDHSMLLS